MLTLNVPEIAGIVAAAAGASAATFTVIRRRRATSTDSRAALLAKRLDEVSNQARRAVAEHLGVGDELDGAVEAYLQTSRALHRALARHLDEEGENGSARERLLWAAAADLHVVENLSLVECSDQARTDEVPRWLNDLAEDGLLPSAALDRLRGEDLTGALLEVIDDSRKGVLPQLQAGLEALPPIAGAADIPADLERTCEQVSDQIISGAVTTITKIFGNTLFDAVDVGGVDLLANAIKFATTGTEIGPVQGRAPRLIIRCLKAAQAKFHHYLSGLSSQTLPLDAMLNWLGEHWQPLIKLRMTISVKIFHRDELRDVSSELIRHVPDAGATTFALTTVGNRHKTRNTIAGFCGRGLRYGAHAATVHPPILAAIAGMGLLTGGITIYIAQDYLDWPRLRFLPDLAVGVIRTLGGHRSDSGGGYPSGDKGTG